MATQNYYDNIDDRDDEHHPIDCDCEDCRLEHAFDECGRLPDHLGGGCQLAGTEQCDFDCPLRDMDFDDE